MLVPQGLIAYIVYKTVSKVAILVMGNIIPVHFMAIGRSELRRLLKSLAY